MNEAAERRVLGLVGLGIRARNAVVGVEQVRMAARKGKLVLAVVAPDASPHSLKKLLPLLKATGTPVVQGPSAATLGGVAGRDSTAAIGIINRSLANGISRLFVEEAAPTGAAGRRPAPRASAQKGFRTIG